MSKDSKSCILFFVKYPVAGRVKTRLAEQFGPEAACDLYKNFVVDTLATLDEFKVNFKIFFEPSDALERFWQWLGEGYSYSPQVGQELGRKMANAFLQAFDEGFGKVVIIGSDIPDLPAEYLELAFATLDTNDVVIGPSGDGGYYLIGFDRNTFLPEVFDGISWSSDSVFEQTVNILKRHERKSYLLPQWHDVDTGADLELLVGRNKNTAFSKSATMSYLEQQKLGDKFNVRL